MFEIRYVPRETIAKLFDWKSIQRALEYSDEEDIDDVFRSLIDGRRVLLLIYDNQQKVADVTVETVEYAKITALRVVTLSGKGYEDWKHDLDKFLVKWAEDEGFHRIEFMGRKGHIRVLKDMGYKPQYVFMTKEIKHGQE